VVGSGRGASQGSGGGVSELGGSEVGDGLMFQH